MGVVSVKDYPESDPPYHGQPIMDRNSFLRKLPHVSDIKSRLAFDAMATAADIVTNAYGELRLLASDIGIDVSQIDEQLASRAIGACWAIVDQLHTIRQLVKAISTPNIPLGPKTQGLLDILEVATLMRNEMDHVAQKLGNLSKRQGSFTPLMGSVSYFHVVDDSMHSGASVTLFSTSLHGEQITQITNPIDRKFVIPLGLFSFYAYNFNLDIETVLNSVMRYFDTLGSNVEQQFESAIAARTSDMGEITDELLGAGRGTFGVVAFFGLDPCS